MERYIGTKIILAEPWARDDLGLVEIGRATAGQVRPGYKVVYEDGYTSWSPKDTFEHAYRRITDAEIALIENGPPRGVAAA